MRASLFCGQTRQAGTSKTGCSMLSNAFGEASYERACQETAWILKNSSLSSLNTMSESLTDLVKHNHYITLPRYHKQTQQLKDVKEIEHAPPKRESSGSHVDSANHVETRPSKVTPKSLAAIRDDDWKSLQNSITYLFHKKKLHGLELDTLNEKVRNVRDSKIGQFIVEYYKDSILKKGMIVLREAIKEKKGPDLLERLGDVWKQFYREILPTLLAIFYPIQEQGIYIRSVTLVGFRDIVLLKTKIEDALEPGAKVSSDISQMLLVLASVQDTIPASENYLRLEKLVARIIRPYLGVDGLYTEHKAPTLRRQSLEQSRVTPKDRKLSRALTFKDDRSRKPRLTSTGSMNEPSLKEGTLRARFRIGTTPSSKSSASDPPELAKAMVDNDMLEYLEYRHQKWKQKEEDLYCESLL